MSITPFKPGEVLFSEGDPVDRVLGIRSGSVEVLRRRNGAEFVLGTVHEGQFLGEMSVVESRGRHGATARAVSEGQAECMSPTEFLDRISRSPDLALRLVERLCYRLHDLEDRIIAEGQSLRRRERTDGLGDKLAVQGITLSAETAGLRRQFPKPLEIGSVPFLVGRSLLPGEASAPRELNFTLEDHVPLRLSRNHFAIVSRNGNYYVDDLRSTLGTAVNGRAIGEHFGSDEAQLAVGENEIVAGGKGSPFVFLVTVSGDGRNARDDTEVQSSHE